MQYYSVAVWTVSSPDVILCTVVIAGGMLCVVTKIGGANEAIFEKRQNKPAQICCFSNQRRRKTGWEMKIS